MYTLKYIYIYTLKKNIYTLKKKIYIFIYIHHMILYMILHVYVRQPTGIIVVMSYAYPLTSNPPLQ